jgi:hypothetical protein
MQVSQGVLRRHSKKIHLIQRGNKTRPVAAESAMKINGMVPFVSQDSQYGFNVLFRRRNRRGIHSTWYQSNPE